MKKLVLLSFLLLATIFVNAQRRGGNPAANLEKRVANLATQLNLSVEQQAQLKAIFVEQQQNRKAGRDLAKAEKEALRAARKEARAATDAKIAAILTPTQLETFNSLAEEKKANRGQRGGAKGDRGRGKGKVKAEKREKATPEIRAQKRTDKLTETLGLDANQQTAVYNLVLNQVPAAKVEKGEWSQLSKEERQFYKENRQKEKAAFEAKMAQILTPAQLEQYQNLPKREKGKKKGKGKQKNKR